MLKCLTTQRLNCNLSLQVGKISAGMFSVVGQSQSQRLSVNGSVDSYFSFVARQPCLS